jgi:hypothetical protein
MTKQLSTAELADTLRELQGNMDDTLQQIRRTLREAAKHDERVHDLLDQAECYWMAHIKTALTKDHDYLGGSFVTMDDTIEELEGVSLFAEGE